MRLERVSLLGTVLGCLLLLGTSPLHAADDGQADLDAATDLQLKAKTLADIEKVISLSESALKKGLDETNAQFANELMVSALWQHASQLAGTILNRSGVNPQWRAIRNLALKDLEKLLSKNEKFVDAYLLRAKLQALPGGNREEAIKAADKAVELLAGDNKKRSAALILRAQLQKESDKKLADLTAAVDADPQNTEAWQTRAAFFIEQGKMDKAIEDFEKLLERDPKNVKVRQALCEALINLEKYDLALQQANRAIEVAPKDEMSYVLRAQIHEAREENDAALADLNKALELDSHNAFALLLRARHYLVQDNLSAARADVDLLLQQEPGTVSAIRLRSLISAAQGRMQDAIADIRLLLRSDPKDTELRLQLASLYVADKRPRKAIELLSELVQEDKDNWAVLRARGDAYLTIGKHEEAIQDFNVALKLKPDDDGLLNNLAWVLATSPVDKLRDGPRAIELATKACELTKYEKPHILSTLAAAYAETGDFETAIKWSTKAVELGHDRLRDQLDQLEKELESYKRKEKVRELQNVDERPDPPRNVIET